MSGHYTRDPACPRLGTSVAIVKSQFPEAPEGAQKRVGRVERRRRERRVAEGGEGGGVWGGGYPLPTENF